MRQIWSFVVPRPPLLPVFEEISPYAVGLVSIKEYPLIRMIGRLKFNNEQNEDNFEEIIIGSEVQVSFQKISEEICLPYWVMG